MVYRDPDTGQFVSSGGGAKAYHDATRIGGLLTAVIPAADLSGGTGDNQVSGDETEIVDFDGYLANDEVFRLQMARVSAVLSLPTTATAEGSGTLKYGIGGSGDINAAIHNTDSFYGSATVAEEGQVDIHQDNHQEMPSIWHLGTLYAENSAADSTNGLGVGGDSAHESELIPFGANLGDGPVYDRDDELYAPFEVATDNISDHAIRGQMQVLLWGHIEELD